MELTPDMSGHYLRLPNGLHELSCGCVVWTVRGSRPNWLRIIPACDDDFDLVDDDLKEDWLLQHIKRGMI